MNPCCGLCRSWRKMGTQPQQANTPLGRAALLGQQAVEVGTCHRFPGMSTALPTPDGQVMVMPAAFPVHRADEWCEEFRPAGNGQPVGPGFTLEAP